MAFCKSCGAELGGAAFCPKCGASQVVSAAPETSAPISSDGLAENVAGLLCYIGGAISGLIFLLIDKRPFVKFHAGQSIALNLVFIVVAIVLSIVGSIFVRISGIFLIGWLFFPILWLAGFLLWIFMMYKAYQHEKFKVPFVGDIVENMIK